MSVRNYNEEISQVTRRANELEKEYCSTRCYR